MPESPVPVALLLDGHSTATATPHHTLVCLKQRVRQRSWLHLPAGGKVRAGITRGDPARSLGPCPPGVVGELDRHPVRRRHTPTTIWRRLVPTPAERKCVPGVQFFPPSGHPTSAQRALLVNFNNWDAGTHPMQTNGWAAILGAVHSPLGRCTVYKYESAPAPEGTATRKPDPLMVFSMKIGPRRARWCPSLGNFRLEGDQAWVKAADMP